MLSAGDAVSGREMYGLAPTLCCFFFVCICKYIQQLLPPSLVYASCLATSHCVHWLAMADTQIAKYCHELSPGKLVLIPRYQQLIVELIHESEIMFLCLEFLICLAFLMLHDSAES